VQSQQSRASTPNQTYEPYQSTFSGNSEYNGPTANDSTASYAPHASPSVAFSETHTPSHCSAVTDDNELYKRGVGPSSPYPFSKWDPFKFENVPEHMDLDGFEQASSGAPDTSGSNAESKRIFYSGNESAC